MTGRPYPASEARSLGAGPLPQIPLRQLLARTALSACQLLQEIESCRSGARDRVIEGLRSIVSEIKAALDPSEATPPAEHPAEAATAGSAGDPDHPDAAPLDDPQDLALAPSFDRVRG